MIIQIIDSLKNMPLHLLLPRLILAFILSVASCLLLYVFIESAYREIDSNQYDELHRLTKLLNGKYVVDYDGEIRVIIGELKGKIVSGDLRTVSEEDYNNIINLINVSNNDEVINHIEFKSIKASYSNLVTKSRLYQSKERAKLELTILKKENEN